MNKLYWKVKLLFIGERERKDLLTTKLTKYHLILLKLENTIHYELFLKNKDKKIPKVSKTLKNPKNGNKKYASLRQTKTSSNLLKPIIQWNIKKSIFLI